MMRFATRTFLLSFVPFAVLLAISFWAVRAAVGSAVRDGLRSSTREHQKALAREQIRNETRIRTFLKGVAENPALKAGLQLLASERKVGREIGSNDIGSGDGDQAGDTVRDQLSEIADALAYDLMLVTGLHGETLAAVVREAGGFTALRAGGAAPFTEAVSGPGGSSQGFFSIDGRLYELTSVPLNEEGAQVATLIVGTRFDIARLGTPAVLLKGGKLVSAETRDLAPTAIEAALQPCPPAEECQVRIQDQTYLSLPIQSAPVQMASHEFIPSATTASNAVSNPVSGNNGYVLRTLQSVDGASAAVQGVVQRLFVIAGLLALLAALCLSAISARSVARPLAGMVALLRQSSATGELAEFPENLGNTREFRELTDGFNQTVRAVREARERLTRAYVEFVGSLAQALDARDSYTAGHSRRVSEYACAIAKAMGLDAESVETIRVGALLHDVGKIGISDLVLQKPGRLTPEENALIQRHPVIGKQILERVRGMEPYLEMIELHHENWDGSGYPRGLKQEETPLFARIVKVADGYDAMTSDRPYRRGMAHADALAILRKVAGTETDVNVVEAFAGLGDVTKEWAVKQQAARQQAAERTGSLHNLAGVVGVQGVGVQGVSVQEVDGQAGATEEVRKEGVEVS